MTGSDANTHGYPGGQGSPDATGNGVGDGQLEGDAAELLDRVRRVVEEADPVPAAVLAAARAAFDLRTLDADLAELVADSRDSAALVRGPSGRRQLAFAAGAVTLDVEVTADGSRRRLLGFAEGTSGPVTAQSSRVGVDPVTVSLDEAGRFLVDGLPAGPTRLSCPGAGGRPVVTAWAVL